LYHDSGSEEIILRLISRGRRAKILLLAGIFQFFACPPPENPRPLNYKELFSVEAGFLQDVTSLAIKGRAEFQKQAEYYSADFTIYISGPDSIYFLFEGTLNVDLFSLADVNGQSYYRDKDSGTWNRLEKGDRLVFDDIEISDMTPKDLGVLVFPQYYLQLVDNSAEGSLYMPSGEIYQAVNSGMDYSSFSLSRNKLPIIASYKQAKKIGDGMYPSRIEIFENDITWSVRFEIEKISLNPRFSDKIWPSFF